MEQFIALVTQGGPLAITALLAWLYFNERSSHDTTRKWLSDLQNSVKTDAITMTREVVGSIASTTAALNKIAEGAEQNRQVLGVVAEAVAEIAIRAGRPPRRTK